MKKIFSLNPNLLIILAIVIIGAVVLLWSKISAVFARLSAQNSTADHGDNYGVVRVNYQDIAGQIYDQIWGWGIFSVLNRGLLGSPDSELIAGLISSLQNNYNVRQMALVYAEKGKDLYSDLSLYMDEQDYNTIKYLLQ